jgi:spore germination cell wall hydrolase CwlJ-like protein
VVAQTLWAEARGEGHDGMVAVACVIGNRVARARGARSYADICRAPYQFSCWNDNDPNRRLIDRVARAPDADYNDALSIAQQLVGGRLGDVTQGATHYYATSMRQRPSWAAGQEPCLVLGGHAFFNHIR